jgi:hypothetical protein
MSGAEVERRTIALTILEQLGGRRFAAMTGARRFLSAEAGLHFQLPARLAKSGIQYVHIDLDLGADLYRMTFMRLTAARSVVTVSQFEGIFCDQLQEIFTRETGLQTSLGRMR